MSTIGFIGVGVMGLPMASNLVAGGHDVRAFDTDDGALERVGRRGAVPTASARDAAIGSDFVITMLPRGEIVQTAVFGSDGAAAGLGDGALLIEMSTVLPREFDELADRLRAAGKCAMDAPVRTSAHAKEGTLLDHGGRSV